VATFLTAVYLSFADSPRLPFWDHWTLFINLAAQNGHYSLAQLWAQHSEHRIVIPKLFLLLDFLLFRATGRFVLICIVLLQAGNALLFCASVASLERLNKTLRIGVCGLVCACLFSPVQLDNFVWPFQISFVAAAFFTSLCFYSFSKSFTLLERPPAKVHPVPFALSLAAAGCATLSLAGGLFCWPVLIAVGVLVGLDRRRVAVLTVIAFVVSAAYMFHYHATAQHADPVRSLRHPAEVLTYLVFYTGGSWSVFGLAACKIIGFTGLLGAALLLSRAVLMRSAQHPEVFAVATLIFVIVTGIFTALGRINFGLEQALSSRYQTVAFTFWVALFIFVLCRLAELHIRWPLVVVCAAALVFAAGPLIRFRAIVDPYNGRAGQWRVAEAGVLSEVDDRTFMKTLSPDLYQTDPALEYLRNHRLSLFSDFRYAELGKPVSSFYRIDGTCRGTISAVAIVRVFAFPGYSVSGWARNPKTGEAPQNFVIADEAGLISGFGVGGYHSVDKTAPASPIDDRWFGFSRWEAKGGIRAYAVLHDRKLCEVGAPQKLNPPVYGPEASKPVRDLSAGGHGVFRSGQWFLDARGYQSSPYGVLNTANTFGTRGDLPVIGECGPSAKLRRGIFRGGEWLLDAADESHRALICSTSFGQRGDIPVLGDWDATGKLRLGVFRDGQWWLDINGDGRWDPRIDRLLQFGQKGDLPIVGDWDGAGNLRIGIFRNGQWWVDINGDFRWTSDADKILGFGLPGDLPVIGNWDHLGKLRIGVFRGGHWYLDMNGNNEWDGTDSDQEIIFGQPGDVTTLFPWPVK
jgi:hypothetical protein